MRLKSARIQRKVWNFRLLFVPSQPRKDRNDEKTIIHGGNGTTGGWLLKQR